MKTIRGAARAAAVLTAVLAATTGMAGTALAAPTTYSFSNATIQQTSTNVACPEWVDFNAFCLELTLTGTGKSGTSQARTERTVTGNAVVALQTDGNKAVRRATFTADGKTSSEYEFTGTWDSTNGSAEYQWLFSGDSVSSVAVKILVPAPPADGSPTETWYGKLTIA